MAGTQDVTLLAGNDVTITGATERNDETHLKQEKKSGLSGTGGIGFSYGTDELKTTDTAAALTNKGSTVGSVNGNVTVGAGNNLAVVGSDLIAGKDMALSGKNVSVTAAENQNSQMHKVEQKTSGLTLALSGTAGSALNTAVETTKQARESDDSRLAALQGTKAALSGVQATQAMRMDGAKGGDPSNDNTVGVSLSYGSQSSSSTTHSEQRTSEGSGLTAGNNLNITAFGDGKAKQEGDILIQGSQLQAGKDATLNANRDINLISGENTSLLDGKNESKGGTVGVGIGVGSGGWGISVSASVNKGKGSESGNGTTHTETTVNAGNNVNILSGRDTNLIGAQVSGETVKADVGRNLTLQSQQDSDNYDSKQQNASAGGSFTFGSMSGSASVNLSKDKMHSTYESVQEQTGIFAGKGGFDITVGEHTQLDGAVIGSTADASKNKLDTGTLGFSDIENKADYKVEHQSVGISTGGSIGSQFAGNMANGLLVGANSEGHASSTTKAAVSDGTITVRDTANQKQDVNDLSRDVENANPGLDVIFDKEREQKRLQQAQLIAEIGNQAADIARTEGQIRATTAGKEELAKRNPPVKEPGEGATKKEWEAYNATLADTSAYKKAQTEWGTGSSIQQGMQAATAAIQGLAGGDIKAAIAGASAPYLAEVIKQTAPNEASRVMAHAVVAGVLAEMQGNNGLAGAAGAATAAASTNAIAKAMYGTDDFSKMTEEQRQTVSALTTLASGLAGGLAGGDSGSALAGGQAGKNTAENNDMKLPSGLGNYGNAVASWGQYATDNNLTPEQTQAGLNKIAKGDLPEGANITKAIVEGYQDGVFMAGAIYLGPTVAIGKGITGAVISGGANSAFQYMNMAPDGEFSYYSAAVAAGTGYLAPGYKIGGNTLINMGGAFMVDGPDGASQAGAAFGGLAGGAFGMYAPNLLRPYVGSLSGLIGDTGSALISETSNDTVKELINKDKK